MGRHVRLRHEGKRYIKVPNGIYNLGDSYMKIRAKQLSPPSNCSPIGKGNIKST